jgi:hypothetical protein
VLCAPNSGRVKVTIGSRIVTVRNEGTTRYSIALNARGRRALRRSRKGTVHVTARFTDVDYTPAARTVRRALRR